MYINSFYDFIIKIQRCRLHVPILFNMYLYKFGVLAEYRVRVSKIPPGRTSPTATFKFTISPSFEKKNPDTPRRRYYNLYTCLFMAKEPLYNIIRPYPIETDNPPPTTGLHSRRSPAR